MKIFDSIAEGYATGKKARLAARGVLNDLNRIPDSDMDEELIGKEARLWYPWIQAMKNVKATYKALLN